MHTSSPFSCVICEKSLEKSEVGIEYLILANKKQVCMQCYEAKNGEVFKQWWKTAAAPVGDENDGCLF